MELTLHPIATQCFVSGRAFAEGDRVVSYLVREASGEIARRDLIETEDGKFMPPAFIYCRWVIDFKQRKADENADRTLKLTAESLFLTLGDPANEPNAANTPLLQFLALMLERKKLIKPRGVTEDGVRQIYEHMKSHQLYEVPIGTLDETFFRNIQEHLGVLVGGPKEKSVAGEPAAPAAEATPTVTA